MAVSTDEMPPRKVRMSEGFYGREEMGSDSDYYLAPVVYPMREMLEDSLSQGEEEVVINNDRELEEWAEQKFVDHTLWWMDVPHGAVHPAPCNAGAVDESGERLEDGIVYADDGMGYWPHNPEQEEETL